MTVRLVVVGDALLDVDLEGSASRLCPDAPVPVVDDAAEHPRPGGAALAAALAAADGADVTLVTGTAYDPTGKQLEALLGDAGVTTVPQPVAGSTPVKKRVRAGGQSLLRLDTGDHEEVTELTQEAYEALDGADVVLVSDYGRGITSCAGLQRRLRELSGRGVPVVWDPHPRGADPTPGVHLVTPNTAEAKVWAGRNRVNHGEGLTAVADLAVSLVGCWRARAVAVTLGPAGALLSYGHGVPMVMPAPAVTAQDCCGAGDRFAATAAVMLGAGSTPAEAVQQAVLAASDFVASGAAAAVRVADGSPSPGTAVPESAEQVVRRVRAAGGVVVATGGCFDLLHAGHVATLRAARRLGDCLVVCLNSDASVRRLKGDGRPLVTDEDRRRVLEALECVDAVTIFDEDTPERALDRLQPDIWAKGGDYSGTELPESAVLRQWGGRAVALPYVAGRSTTELVQRAVDGDQPAYRPDNRREKGAMR